MENMMKWLSRYMRSHAGKAVAVYWIVIGAAFLAFSF
jgi:undecaprenyl pyrophosphate phosphatase UppP